MGPIDLANKRVLEIGCGTGYHVWFLAHHFGSEATGIDVAERNTWKTLSDEKTKFVWADITDANPLPEKHFDRIISFAVWEHVTHPYRALQEVYRMLRPGGLVWMNANLHRGPLASHALPTNQVPLAPPPLLGRGDPGVLSAQGPKGTRRRLGQQAHLGAVRALLPADRI